MEEARVETPTLESTENVSEGDMEETTLSQLPISSRRPCPIPAESAFVDVILDGKRGFLLSTADSNTNTGRSSRQSFKKKDSIFNLNLQQYKIPIEIGRTARGRPNKRGWRRYAGIFLALLSSISFAVTVLLAKVLRESYGFHPISVTVWRYVGILIPAIPVSICLQFCTSENILGSVWPLNSFKSLKNCCVLLLQGIFGCTSIIFLFYSLEFLSIGDTVLISYSAPVLVTVLAYIFLGDKCSILSVFIAFFTSLGVVIIARPPIFPGTLALDTKVVVGVVLAVASMACASVVVILLRNIRKTHFALVLLVSGIWGVIQSGTLALTLGLMKLPGDTEEGILLTLLCLLTFCGQLCVIFALKYENAGKVSIAKASEVLFAFLLQMQFLSETPDIFSGIGSLIIIFSVIILAICGGLSCENAHHGKRLLSLKEVTTQ